VPESWSRAGSTDIFRIEVGFVGGTGIAYIGNFVEKLGRSATALSVSGSDGVFWAADFARASREFTFGAVASVGF
jgi:hypothetical protein